MHSALTKGQNRYEGQHRRTDFNASVRSDKAKENQTHETCTDSEEWMVP